MKAPGLTSIDVVNRHSLHECWEMHTLDFKGIEANCSGVDG